MLPKRHFFEIVLCFMWSYANNMLNFIILAGQKNFEKKIQDKAYLFNSIVKKWNELAILYYCWFRIYFKCIYTHAWLLLAWLSQKYVSYILRYSILLILVQFLITARDSELKSLSSRWIVLSVLFYSTSHDFGRN